MKTKMEWVEERRKKPKEKLKDLWKICNTLSLTHTRDFYVFVPLKKMNDIIKTNIKSINYNEEVDLITVGISCYLLHYYDSLSVRITYVTYEHTPVICSPRNGIGNGVGSI